MRGLLFMAEFQFNLKIQVNSAHHEFERIICLFSAIYNLNLTIIPMVRQTIRKGKKRKPKKMNILLVAKQNPAGMKAARAVYKRLQEFADVHLDLTTSLRLR